MDRELVIRWAIAVGVTLGAWAVGWLVRRVLLATLMRLMRRTRTDLDDILVETIRPHLPFWFLVLGVTFGVRYGDPGPQPVAIVDKLSVAALMLSGTLVVATFLTRVLASRARELPGALPATGLTQNAIRIAVIVLGVLVILGNLGIAITPILTALGVGSLAVALALQPTLSNLFAGFQITIARRVRVGDYIELETGQQGFVTDIGWRSVEIRELPNNLILVPNAKLAELIVRNYSLPEDEQSALVQVGVSYASDLEQVEQVTIATAKEVLASVPGGVEGFDPFIRYHTFGDSSINFSVILRVKGFADRYLVTHEFVKRLHRKFAEAGIEIPFPQRVVHMVERPPAND